MSVSDVSPDEFPRPVAEIRDAWIPMPDGTRLAARIWLPVDAAADPVPGILELLPYRKNDGTTLRDARNAPYFAGHGYAVVRVDMRGTGNSEGVITDEYTETELADGVACIAWISAQRWCTGKVGIMGISWGGFNGLQIAALQPPELHAVLSLCSTDDRYADDVHYWGGALLADYQLPWATTMLAYNARPPEPHVWGADWLARWRERLAATPPFIEEWMRHQRRDEFWRHGSVCENPEAIRCPVYLVGGWADAYRDAVFRLLESLTVPRRGLIGPWSHAWPHFATPGPRVGFLREATRWWDRWLKDVPNGIEDEPMLRAWLQDSVPPRAHHDHRPGRWVAAQSWPTPTVEHRPAALAPGGLMIGGSSVTAASSEVAAVQSHGVLGGRSCSYGTAFDEALDQRGEDAVSLCFDSDPLAERMDVLGVIEAELELSANRNQALVAVRVCDVARDGTSTLITRGVLNLTHRDGHERPELLEPDRRYLVRFPLHAIGYSIPAGHRVRVAIAPACWPIVWPSPEPVRLTVFMPGSRVHFPVLIGDADARFPFPEPQQAQQFAHTVFDESEQGTITRDLVTGCVTTVYDSGVGYEREELGEDMRYHSHERDIFRIVDEDPTAAAVLAERRIELSRGDWHTSVVAKGEMTCDKDAFYVDTELTTWLDDRQIFHKRWRFRTPRDMT
jgi:uncharacterized protein